MSATIRYSLRALAPVHHGTFGVPTGNTIAFRRLQIAGGGRVPAISGNAIRGVTRRLVMRDLFARCGLSRATLARGWDRLYAALANGGHLDGAEKVRSADAMRALRASLPPLSVYGAALYSWMLAGHMDVGFAWLRCRETVAAGLCSCGHDAAAGDLVDDLGVVRHVDREEQDPEVSGVGPMPVTVETVVTGSVFEGAIAFRAHATPEERGAVAYGLDLLRTVGGKAGQGLGAVEAAHDGDAAPYLAWLAADQAAARQALCSLAEELA
jgi:hypothetical protein